MTEEFNNRILIVDDTPSIHEDFKKILPLHEEEDNSLESLLDEILGDNGQAAPEELYYVLDHAFQGEEAVRMATAAHHGDRPYAVVFMDVRMPPGMDGIEAIRRIWEVAPDTECVICTAFSDYSWESILEKVGSSDQLQFLRKPFDVVSIKQMALALTKKWDLNAKSRRYTADLEREVAERTKDLARKVEELEAAIEEISQLQGILPMCAYCHKVRDDSNYWQRVDEYINTRTPAQISHGVCPECYEKLLQPILDEAARQKGAGPADSE